MPQRTITFAASLTTLFYKGEMFALRVQIVWILCFDVKARIVYGFCLCLLIAKIQRHYRETDYSIANE